MNFDVVLLGEAEEDISGHFAFIANTSIDKALLFQKSVFMSLDLLRTNPLIGPPFRSDNPKLIDLRMWFVKGFEKYLIFYRPYGNYLEVVRVLHSSQDRDAILVDE
ncbi:MAG TPA: type II toxin-antitoxin system RelE/ParE family toxin [Pyrinomonadaceae bacterium]|nr:type II toxin-antitoxin system RelE/ParE family toxin [Pyrinomonadaceae bacterium]